MVSNFTSATQPVYSRVKVKDCTDDEEGGAHIRMSSSEVPLSILHILRNTDDSSITCYSNQSSVRGREIMWE
jgi:hypothetical protein